jgi:hypothetical protein
MIGAPLMRTRPAVLTGALLASGVLSACNELPADPIDIHNQSNQLVSIVRVLDTGDSLVERIAPNDHSVREGCIDPDLEARLDDGRVVANRPGPFCEGDPQWAITQADVDAASVNG